MAVAKSKVALEAEIEAEMEEMMGEMMEATDAEMEAAEEKRADMMEEVEAEAAAKRRAALHSALMYANEVQSRAQQLAKSSEGQSRYQNILVLCGRAHKCTRQGRGVASEAERGS